MRYAIGIDLGGTHVKVRAVTEQGQILGGSDFATHDTAGEGWAAHIRSEVRALETRQGSRAARIGVGTPGLPDRGHMVDVDSEPNHQKFCLGGRPATAKR